VRLDGLLYQVLSRGLFGCARRESDAVLVDAAAPGDMVDGDVIFRQRGKWSEARMAAQAAYVGHQCVAVVSEQEVIAAEVVRREAERTAFAAVRRVAVVAGQLVERIVDMR